jgi:hypothetical protein
MEQHAQIDILKLTAHRAVVRYLEVLPQSAVAAVVFRNQRLVGPVADQVAVPAKDIQLVVAPELPVKAIRVGLGCMRVPVAERERQVVQEQRTE